MDTWQINFHEEERRAYWICNRRTVVERLLQSRLVYKRASMPKALNFEYLNRQLVWHELSELLLFLLPLINVTRIKAIVMKSLPQVYQPSKTTGDISYT